MMSNIIYIYLDDERDPPVKSNSKLGIEVVVCRTYDSAIKTIDDAMSKGQYVFLDLDHDLGPGKSGYDVCKYVVGNEISRIAGYKVHSMNPVGRDNMIQLMDRAGYDRQV